MVKFSVYLNKHVFVMKKRLNKTKFLIFDVNVMFFFFFFLFFFFFFFFFFFWGGGGGGGGGRFPFQSQPFRFLSSYAVL